MSSTNFRANEAKNEEPVVSDIDDATPSAIVGRTRSSACLFGAPLENLAKRSDTVASDWRVDLNKAFPGFFSSMVLKVASGVALPIECGRGWHDVIFRCCARIDGAIADRESFRFERIVERQGVLRFYWGGWLSVRSQTKVRLAIDLAEARSQCLCEICGERGQLHRHENAFGIRCSAHAHGKPVPVKPGFENMHLRQKTVVGRVRAVVCSFYDFERDAFVDVGPSEL